MAIRRDDQQFIDTTQQATRVIDIGGGGGGGGGLTDAELRATPVPVSGTVTATPPAGTQRSMLNTLLTAGADRIIPAGRKSFTVVLSAKAGAGSPTLDGVELPAAGTYTYAAEQNDTLNSATVATAAGDVALIMELF